MTKTKKVKKFINDYHFEILMGTISVALSAAYTVVAVYSIKADNERIQAHNDWAPACQLLTVHPLRVLLALFPKSHTQHPAQKLCVGKRKGDNEDEDAIR